MRMWLFITKYKELFIISIPLVVISIFLVILNNSVTTYTKTNQKEFNNIFSLKHFQRWLLYNLVPDLLIPHNFIIQVNNLS